MDLLIQRHGRQIRLLIVGDGDRRNATLAGLYPPGSLAEHHNLRATKTTM